MFNVMFSLFIVEIIIGCETGFSDSVAVSAVLF